MSNITKTFKKPYYVVIFISKVTNNDFLLNEANLDMVGLAPKQQGFLGMDRARMDDGLGFSISYWESLEAIELWRENQRHSEIQNNARKNWLSEYTLRTAKVEYDQHFDVNSEFIPTFSMDDLTLLYSYITKHLYKYISNNASLISRQIIKVMENERGKRMAQYCLSDNNELSIKNFLLYSEWDTRNKYNEYEAISFENEDVLNISPYVESIEWKENNIFDDSNNVFFEIDKELMEGFNSDIKFNVIQFLKNGNNYYDFNWIEQAFKNKKELDEFNKEREIIIPKVTKDYLYHTAHLYSCASKIIRENVEPIIANQILASIIVDYKKNFGTKKSDLIIEKSKENLSLSK